MTYNFSLIKTTILNLLSQVTMIGALSQVFILLSDHVNLEQNAKENAVNCLIIGSNVVMFEVLFDSFPEYE